MGIALKPTQQAYEVAIAHGTAARQCGRRESDCPFKLAATEPLRTLREGWMPGFQREAMARKAAITPSGKW